MIEVFKTNVEDHHDASLLVARINKSFAGYTANFDLDDCDRILRVKCLQGEISSASVITLLKDFGFSAQILSDHEPEFSAWEKLTA